MERRGGIVRGLGGHARNLCRPRRARCLPRPCHEPGGCDKDGPGHGDGVDVSSRSGLRAAAGRAALPGHGDEHRHGAGRDDRLHQLARRHARRCPSDARSGDRLGYALTRECRRRPRLGSGADRKRTDGHIHGRCGCSRFRSDDHDPSLRCRNAHRVECRTDRSRRGERRIARGCRHVSPSDARRQRQRHLPRYSSARRGPARCNCPVGSAQRTRVRHQDVPDDLRSLHLPGRAQLGYRPTTRPHGAGRVGAGEASAALHSLAGGKGCGLEAPDPERDRPRPWSQRGREARFRGQADSDDLGVRVQARRLDAPLRGVPQRSSGLRPVR